MKFLKDLKMFSDFRFVEKEYPVESIWLPKTKSKIRGTVMEKEKVGAFIETVSEEQIWSGPFILPSDGQITTGYGLQRYYNGVFAEQYEEKRSTRILGCMNRNGFSCQAGCNRGLVKCCYGFSLWS